MKTQVVSRDEAVAELATWEYKGHLYTEAAVLLKVGVAAYKPNPAGANTSAWPGSD